MSDNGTSHWFWAENGRVDPPIHFEWLFQPGIKFCRKIMWKPSLNSLILCWNEITTRTRNHDPAEAQLAISNEQSSIEWSICHCCRQPAPHLRSSRRNMELCSRRNIPKCILHSTRRKHWNERLTLRVLNHWVTTGNSIGIPALYFHIRLKSLADVRPEESNLDHGFPWLQPSVQ